MTNFKLRSYNFKVLTPQTYITSPFFSPKNFLTSLGKIFFFLMVKFIRNFINWGKSPLKIHPYILGLLLLGGCLPPKLHNPIPRQHAQPTDGLQRCCTCGHGLLLTDRFIKSSGTFEHGSTFKLVLAKQCLSR